MKEIEAIEIIAKITTSDLDLCVSNLKDMLMLANSLMYGRAKRVNFETERLHISNLLAQKILLHSSSIFTNSQGINFPINEITEMKIPDPFSLNVIFRSLVECYLTMNHINFAETDEEKEMRFNVWSQYGLGQRKKTTFSELELEGQMVQENDQKEIEELTKEIKTNIYFLNLENQKKDKYLAQILKDWKFGFQGNTYIKYSWQDLLDKTGLKKKLFNDLYNYLSWFAHSSSISIYQLRDIYRDSSEMIEIENIIRDTAVFVAVTITDLIKIDSELKKEFDILEYDEKNLVNIYNLVYRDESHTIDFKID